MTSHRWDSEPNPRLARIVAAFEHSRFESLDLHWKDGVLRLRKDAAGNATNLASRIVTAPRVGIFRAGLTVRSSVTRNAPLGFVDVLGERHAVTAPVDGTVAECCAEDGGFVEYGAPLFRLTER